MESKKSIAITERGIRFNTRPETAFDKAVRRAIA
jgi:hypothetical protein